MSRSFIAGVLAASLAIAGLSALPARAADADDVARFVGAAATLFILGKIIESKRDDKDHASVATKSRPRGHAALPGSCLHYVGRGGHRPVLGAHCLKRSYRGYHHLPNACRVSVWYKGRDRAAYGLRCLNQRGYRVAGRH